MPEGGTVFVSVRDADKPGAVGAGELWFQMGDTTVIVDVTEDMGPFEIAPGTQWDDLGDGDPMFPPVELWPRYAARAQRKLPKMGDISARSALTIHRGTANESDRSRPVFVLGVDAPDARNADKHDLQLTHAYYDSLAPDIRRHITCRVVDRLEPIVQAHTIEGLKMGVKV